MRKIIILLFLTCSFIFYTGYSVAHASFNNESQINKENNLILEEAFLRSMGPEILKAINQYYGKTRLYFLERITKVTKDKNEDTFDVTVQVVTYEKAILPPYGLETITFKIPGFKVIDFNHKNIKGEDLPEDKFD